MHWIGCSFWVTFRSCSYVWLLKLSIDNGDDSDKETCLGLSALRRVA